MFCGVEASSSPHFSLNFYAKGGNSALYRPFDVAEAVKHLGHTNLVAESVQGQFSRRLLLRQDAKRELKRAHTKKGPTVICIGAKGAPGDWNPIEHDSYYCLGRAGLHDGTTPM